MRLEFGDLIGRVDGAVAVGGIYDNKISVGGHTWTVVIDSAEVVAVVVGAFEVSETGVDEVGGGDTGGYRKLADDLIQIAAAGVFSVELPPPEWRLTRPKSSPAGHE